MSGLEPGASWFRVENAAATPHDPTKTDVSTPRGVAGFAYTAGRSPHLYGREHAQVGPGPRQRKWKTERTVPRTGVQLSISTHLRSNALDFDSCDQFTMTPPPARLPPVSFTPIVAARLADGVRQASIRDSRFKCLSQGHKIGDMAGFELAGPLGSELNALPLRHTTLFFNGNCLRPKHLLGDDILDTYRTFRSPRTALNFDARLASQLAGLLDWHCAQKELSLRVFKNVDLTQARFRIHVDCSEPCLSMMAQRPEGAIVYPDTCLSSINGLGLGSGKGFGYSR
ncbi:hypothetical protein Bbelb_320320 [Branchiostoma belcheri]|nr:hypothetical protein Bbelb_320320 [Branchiostoma belcheri]